MTRVILALAGCLAAAALPVLAESNPKQEAPFDIVYDSKYDLQQSDKDGKLMLSVSFGIDRKRSWDASVTYKVVIIEEPERENKEQVIYPVPRSVEEIPLAVVLVMDTSGGMAQWTQTKTGKITRMDQMKEAAGAFFHKLPGTSDAGLVLFNDKVYDVKSPPTNRQALLNAVKQAKPAGGAAYIDAAYQAVELVKDFPKSDRVVVVMTDGVDKHSKRKQEEVVALANQFGVKVHTIGIGKPLPPPVTTMLVLDKSGSMKLQANDRSTTTKIDDLKAAAKGFVATMGDTRRCAIMVFGDAPETPTDFKNDKVSLQKHIDQIKAEGETCLFDALYDAIITLEAEGSSGKRAVVALTDGIDNKSRRRMEEVIEAAQKADIPLYLLGFGRPGELDLATMDKVAKATKGEFHHADNRDKLVSVFEDLSSRIYDVGIQSLEQLAVKTKGSYFPAEDVERLQFAVDTVVKAYDKRETFTFASVRQKRDGLPREIKFAIRMEEGGKTTDVGGVGGGRVNVRGVVIAEMSPVTYLVFLCLLGGLIALPAVMKRKQPAT